MNRYPDELLILIFSFVKLRERVKLESVSRRWRRILIGKDFRKLGIINLDYLVGDVPTNQLRIPHAIYSLVVQKDKIIEGIVSEFQNTQVLLSVMPTITSAQSQHLKHLKLTISTECGVETLLGFPDYSDLKRLCKFVSLCVNVEVLQIDSTISHHTIHMDLSQLVQLKILRGNGVYFVNVQAFGLVELEYKNVCIAERDDFAFRQMMLVISSSVQVLNLDHVTQLKTEVYEYDEAEVIGEVEVIGMAEFFGEPIQLPELRQLSLHANIIIGFVIDFSESTYLDSLVVHDQFLSSVNFDLSVHCLTRFDVRLDAPLYRAIVNQFITSAVRHHDRFCLLKELAIAVVDNDLMNDLFNSISRLNNYCFEKFHFINRSVYGFNDDDHLITRNLLDLVDCCPVLESIVLTPFDFVLDKQTLIDVIISRMRIVDVDFYLEFGFIENSWDLAVLHDIYDAVDAVGTCVEERHCDIKIVMCFGVDGQNSELIDLVKKFADNFRIFFTIDSLIQHFSSANRYAQI